MMKSFHVRMAELTFKREKTAEDMRELKHCLQLNLDYVQSMANLENHSLAASIIGNDEEQHAICKLIDELQDDPHASKLKKA